MRDKKRGREKGDCGKVAGGVGCHCNGVCHGPRVPTTPAAEAFLVRSTVKYAETSKPFARVKLVVITRINIYYIHTYTYIYINMCVCVCVYR